VHPAGERLFVDFAGRTVPVVEGASGEERQADIFVAVLGASSFTYACATRSQTLPDWIGAHVRVAARNHSRPDAQSRAFSDAD